MNNVEKMTDIVAKFVAYTAKKLPDDVIAKLEELGAREDSPMARVIYETMFRNQELAVKLDRPSCQDTGVLQFWIKSGFSCRWWRNTGEAPSLPAAKNSGSIWQKSCLLPC